MKSHSYVALFFLRSPTLSKKVRHINCIMHLLILSFLLFGLTLSFGKFFISLINGSIFVFFIRLLWDIYLLSVIIYNSLETQLEMI